MFKIEGVTGDQFNPEDKGYSKWHAQYASSTYQDDHNMNPDLIVLPNDKNDIKLAVQFANEHKKAIAIRTGGHQYSGASSTGPGNILLDLRRTFKQDLDHFPIGLDSKSYVRASVSHSLGDFNAFLGKKKASCNAPCRVATTEALTLTTRSSSLMDSVPRFIWVGTFRQEVTANWVAALASSVTTSRRSRSLTTPGMNAKSQSLWTRTSTSPGLVGAPVT